MIFAVSDTQIVISNASSIPIVISTETKRNGEILLFYILMLKFFRIWCKIPHFMLKNVKIVKAKKFCYIFAAWIKTDVGSLG